jgi:membrane protein
LTATGMVAYSVGSLYYMPHAIEESADRFGSIGIAIAIVSWLIGVGFVLVVAAAFGAVLASRRALKRQAQ